MEEDIKNYLQTVMFRGTPCRFQILKRTHDLTIKFTA